jgi:hypothetical protein
VHGLTADHSVPCPNGHRVCTACLRRLVRPCDSEGTGLYFRCPLCRADAGLSRLHVAVLLLGSWTEVRKVWGGDEEVVRWTEAGL